MPKSIRIVEIQRFADQVIGGAGDRPPLARPAGAASARARRATGRGSRSDTSRRCAAASRSRPCARAARSAYDRRRPSARAASALRGVLSRSQARPIEQQRSIRSRTVRLTWPIWASAGSGTSPSYASYVTARASVDSIESSTRSAARSTSATLQDHARDAPRVDDRIERIGVEDDEVGVESGAQRPLLLSWRYSADRLVAATMPCAGVMPASTIASSSSCSAIPNR